MAKDQKGHGSNRRTDGARPRVVKVDAKRPRVVTVPHKHPFHIQGPLQTKKPRPAEAVKRSGAPAKSRPRVVPAPISGAAKSRKGY